MNGSFILKSKIYTFVGLLFMLVPLFYQILWIYVFSKFDNHAERVEEFRRYLPSIISEPGTSSIIFIVFCFLAIILSLICLKHSIKLLKVVNITTLIVAGALMSLLLFSLL